MEDRVSRLVHPYLKAVLLAVLVAVLLWPAITRGAPQTQPPVPHELVGREDCSACHGADGLKPVPADHEGRANDTCLNCHAGPTEVSIEAVADKDCLACHGNPDLSLTLPSGEVLSLYVDEEAYAASVHGRELLCTACHHDFIPGAHPAVRAYDLRDFSLEAYTACKQCHSHEYERTLDSIHALAQAGGVREAAVCTDCHGAHAVADPDQPRQRISQTCAQCHDSVYQEYLESVHGAALFEESNPDVPVCTDCHRVHNVWGPDVPAFRTYSPRLCGHCHADETLMAKYGLSTAVFRTYVADFHSTSIQLFENQPDTRPNEAVCFDCHGAHDIRPTDDPESSVVKENLLKACRKCHPNATANFPAAWVGHYVPSPEKASPVYYTNLFFTVLTVSVMLALMGYIVLDYGRLVLAKIVRRGPTQ
ncbi:MAG: cytochrome c3 family protein [Dehalococcoidia bacterium]